MINAFLNFFFLNTHKDRKKNVIYCNSLIIIPIEIARSIRQIKNAVTVK